MLTPSYTRQFAKDIKRMINRGKIYKKTGDEIIFERTGTHSDLFE